MDMDQINTTKEYKPNTHYMKMNQTNTKQDHTSSKHPIIISSHLGIDKQTHVRVYLYKGFVSDTPDSSETVNYEAFVLRELSGQSETRLHKFTSSAETELSETLQEQV